MSEFKVCFWVSDTEEKPVANWIKGLTTVDRIYLGDLLRDLAHGGPRARPRVFKHIEGLLWECRDLRSPGPGFRIYFSFDGEVICIVVAAGNKSSQSRDIATAKKRLKMKEEI